MEHLLQKGPDLGAAEEGEGGVTRDMIHHSSELRSFLTSISLICIQSLLGNVSVAYLFLRANFSFIEGHPS